MGDTTFPGLTTPPATLTAPALRGLARHMDEARGLHARALTADLLDAAGVELVHDLRVAIRRCRSLAQGLAAVDIGARPLWRAVSATARPLFAGLGSLRDAQVMREWVDKLVVDEAVRGPALADIDAAIAARVDDARAAVATFDVVTWMSLADTAPGRADEMLRHRPALLWLAIVRWQEARALHVDAMRRRSPEALHEVRIGVKRLRYTLESLLPDLNKRVQKPLKRLQDLLGEIHDLDVVAAWLAPLGPQALAGVAAARAERLAAYKAMATGRTSVWTILRAVLPTRADGVARCRRAYVLEVAAGLGVDGRQARRTERTALALARHLGTPLAPLAQLAVLLAAAKPRRARKATRRLLGFSPDERRAIRRALRHDGLVRAATTATSSSSPP